MKKSSLKSSKINPFLVILASLIGLSGLLYLAQRQVSFPKAAVTYQPSPSCNCTGWINVSGTSCGGAGCAAGTRRQSRTCSPSSCGTTNRCYNDGSCSTQPIPTTQPSSAHIHCGDPSQGHHPNAHCANVSDTCQLNYGRLDCGSTQKCGALCSTVPTPLCVANRWYCTGNNTRHQCNPQGTGYGSNVTCSGANQICLPDTGECKDSLSCSCNNWQETDICGAGTTGCPVGMLELHRSCSGTCAGVQRGCKIEQTCNPNTFCTPPNSAGTSGDLPRCSLEIVAFCKSSQWVLDPNYSCATENSCPTGCTDTGTVSQTGRKICKCGTSSNSSIFLLPYQLAVSATSNNYSKNSDGTKAIDENNTTAWNAGGPAPQWITVDTKRVGTVSKIRLLPNQNPTTITTTHLIKISSSSSSDRSIVAHTFKGTTINNVALEKTFSPPLTNVRYITIETTASPSWVSWFEIQVWP